MPDESSGWTPTEETTIRGWKIVYESLTVSDILESAGDRTVLLAKALKHVSSVTMPTGLPTSKGKLPIGVMQELMGKMNE